MTIYELLKKDHKEVSALFKKLENCMENKSEQSGEIFNTIKEELLAHAAAEEEVFYAPLKARSEADEDKMSINEAYQEHHVVALLINEMSRMEINSEEWCAKAVVLSEIVEHHVEEEESEVFEKARKILSRKEAQDMAIEMQEKKEQYKGKIEDVLKKALEIISSQPLQKNGNSIKETSMQKK
jgi:hypothetical protein